MEEKRIFLIKLILSESLMAIGIIPIFLRFFLPGGWMQAGSESYEAAKNAIWVWAVISPIFFWAGGILLFKMLGDKMPLGDITWFGLLFMLQIIWIMLLLYTMVIY